MFDVGPPKCSNLYMDDKLKKAKQLAEDNYEEWGQWVVECMTDEELKRDIGEDSLEEWVEFRKRIASIHRERESEIW